MSAQFCFALLVVVFPILLQAQPSLWLTLGPSVNHQTTFQFYGSNLIREGFFEVSPAIGWQVQAGADFSIADDWTFETGLGFRKWHLRDRNVGPITFASQTDTVTGLDTVYSDIVSRSCKLPHKPKHVT